MSDPKVGVLIDDTEMRDAIHVAIAPVVATTQLTPGQDIGFVNDGDTVNVSGAGKRIGIVDPFLKMPVKPGQRFFMFLYPRTITSLRHGWTHPAFGAEEENAKADSKAWIVKFAERHGETYEDVIAAAERFVRSGDYWNQGDKFEGEHVPEEFWRHYERVTGKVVQEGDRQSFFTCSC